MKTEIRIPDSISSRIEFKRKFGLWEMYRGLVLVPRAIVKIAGNKKKKLVDVHLLERLQLAITEVNGCAACSYQHARIALRQGMDHDEIMSFLSGHENFVKPEEAKAIMFAQHFADSRGYPQKFAYESIENEYGAEEADVMLSASQVMIAGNMYGIPFSAFQSRLKGKPFKDSSLVYELGMLIAGVFFLPFAILHGLFRGLIGLPNRRFDADITDG